MHAFLPSADSLITRKFSVGSLDLKTQNKTALQQEFGWPQEARRPLLCLPLGMTDQLGGELFKEVLPGILSLPVELLVLGKGSATYGSLFTKLAKEQSHRVAIVSDEETAFHKMIAAADMALFFTNPIEKKELGYCLQYGVVPIAPRCALLEDYNPVQETGNAFTFDTANKWNVFASLVRAAETHKFPFDWRTIERHCMETAIRKEAAHLLQ
jgi:glycogen synthase